MILDFLDPKVVDSATRKLLTWLDEEKRAWQTGNADAKAVAAKYKATDKDVEKAKDEIEEWRKKEVKELSGPQDKPPIWVPRGSVANLLLSEFDGFFLDQGLTTKPVGPGFARGETFVSNVQLSPEALELLTSDRKGLLPRFGQSDARFLTWGAAAKVSTYFKGGPHPFPEGHGPVRNISENSRLILVSDWGSGIPRAEKVGTAMRMLVEESQRNKQECHVIHLGDVYYCGWRREYERRFLESWPVLPDEKHTVGSWCLNANHDMYSGGYDYFNFLLLEPRFHCQNKHSYFALENDHWQIAGLDTAYSEWELHGEQANWLASLRRSAPRKKGILLSHHQPFSSYEKDGKPENLRAALDSTLSEGLIKAWFWGHEHRCARYKPNYGIEYPRLIGHGGIPVYAWAGSMPGDVLWESTDVMQDHLTKFEYARFGFVVLDFQADGSALVRYISENGKTQTEETLR